MILRRSQGQPSGNVAELKQAGPSVRDKPEGEMRLAGGGRSAMSAKNRLWSNWSSGHLGKGGSGQALHPPLFSLLHVRRLVSKSVSFPTAV